MLLDLDGIRVPGSWVRHLVNICVQCTQSIVYFSFMRLSHYAKCFALEASLQSFALKASALSGLKALFPTEYNSHLFNKCRSRDDEYCMWRSTSRILFRAVTFYNSCQWWTCSIKEIFHVLVLLIILMFSSPAIMFIVLKDTICQELKKFYAWFTAK